MSLSGLRRNHSRCGVFKIWNSVNQIGYFLSMGFCFVLFCLFVCLFVFFFPWRIDFRMVQEFCIFCYFCSVCVFVFVFVFLFVCLFVCLFVFNDFLTLKEPGYSDPSPPPLKISETDR